MSVRLFSDSHLYRTGSLKWTGITTASGEPTIGAWVAEMDFGTAPEVADAMKGAIDDGLLGYQPTWLEPRIAGVNAPLHANTPTPARKETSGKSAANRGNLRHARSSAQEHLTPEERARLEWMREQKPPHWG